MTDATGGHRVESEMERLLDEQAALRRVATLVARGVAPEEVFGAVAAEISGLFGGDVSAIVRFEDDGTATVLGDVGGPHEAGVRVTLDSGYVVHTVRETSRPARFDTNDPPAADMGTLVRSLGVRSAVASPIVVQGELWGAITVASQHGPLSPTTERRLTEFTELVATAIANAESREALAQLADEQAALRRVATLIAEDAPPSELFGAVTREAGELLGGDFVGLARFDDDTVVTVGVWAAEGKHPPVPQSWPRQPGDPATTIAETRAPARWIDWTDVPGPIAEFIRGMDIHSTVGTPIVVEGEIWGALALHSKQGDALPPDTESRMAQFTGLIATAIANREARAEVARLAEEQAALRRVATLVAEDAPASELFEAVTREVGVLLGGDLAGMARFEEESVVTVGTWAADGEHPPVPARWPMQEGDPATIIMAEGGPVRRDDWADIPGPIAEFIRGQGIRCTVGAPIIVRGRMWGAIALHSRQSAPLPPDTESRIAQFTDLVATAVANAHAREEVTTLADEQAALRRVAELVAGESSPAEIFNAVTDEAWRVLNTAIGLLRFDADEAVLVSQSHTPWDPPPLGSRFALDGENVVTEVVRTERVARTDDWTDATGAITAMANVLGVRSIVAAPIVLESRLWGTLIAASRQVEPLPGNTESRMEQFAGLVATAIAKAAARDELMASRARLVTAGDAARRRVVRDLHDGAQQRLVHTIVTLKLARQALRADPAELESLIGRALEHAEESNVALRELAHGILPASLASGGVAAGIDALVGRLGVPVRVNVPPDRFEPAVEASAYFIVAEALTNVVKHARATAAEVEAYAADGMLHVEVRDDGVGGAYRYGHGLVGLADRAAALGGWLEVESPALGGTRVAATLPLNDGSPHSRR